MISPSGTRSPASFTQVSLATKKAIDASMARMPARLPCRALFGAVAAEVSVKGQDSMQGNPMPRELRPRRDRRSALRARLAQPCQMPRWVRPQPAAAAAGPAGAGGAGIRVQAALMRFSEVARPSSVWPKGRNDSLVSL